MLREQKSIIVIPARLNSSRLPRKILADIEGKPMLQRVIERCKETKEKYKVVVCTDNNEVKSLSNKLGVEVLMTPSSCTSGSERIAHALNELMEIAWEININLLDKEAYILKLKNSLFINVQGDQPFIDPRIISKMVFEFNSFKFKPDFITPIYKLKKDSIHNPNVVKALIANTGRIIYFSRSALPHVRGVPQRDWHKHSSYWGHVGMYGFRGDIISKWTVLSKSQLENIEKLEQLKLTDLSVSLLK